MAIAGSQHTASVADNLRTESVAGRIPIVGSSVALVEASQAGRLRLSVGRRRSGRSAFALLNLMVKARLRVAEEAEALS